MVLPTQNRLALVVQNLQRHGVFILCRTRDHEQAEPRNHAADHRCTRGAAVVDVQLEGVVARLFLKFVERVAAEQSRVT